MSKIYRIWSYFKAPSSVATKRRILPSALSTRKTLWRKHQRNEEISLFSFLRNFLENSKCRRHGFVRNVLKGDRYHFPHVYPSNSAEGKQLPNMNKNILLLKWWYLKMFLVQQTQMKEKIEFVLMWNVCECVKLF